MPGGCHNENVVLSCPFFHVKIPTEPFHCPSKLETSPSAGDKNTGEQLHNLDRWPGHSQGGLLLLEEGDPCREHTQFLNTVTGVTGNAALSWEIQ